MHRWGKGIDQPKASSLMKRPDFRMNLMVSVIIKLLDTEL